MSATDDGSRITAHFWQPSLKVSTLLQFEKSLAVVQASDKQGKEAAQAYLQALTGSRSEFTSKLDSSAANTDAELDEAASAYFSLLLGLVNNYAQPSCDTELDQETGQLLINCQHKSRGRCKIAISSKPQCRCQAPGSARLKPRKSQWQC